MNEQTYELIRLLTLMGIMTLEEFSEFQFKAPVGDYFCMHYGVVIPVSFDPKISFRELMGPVNDTIAP